MTPTDWNEYPTLEALREEAKRLKIKGRSKMDRDELIAALQADEAERAETNKRIAVLTPNFGEVLIMRSNPSEEDVRGFVEVQNHRHDVGATGGPDGYPAVRVLEAVFYPDEDSYKRGDVDSVGEPIDLSDIL